MLKISCLGLFGLGCIEARIDQSERSGNSHLHFTYIDRYRILGKVLEKGLAGLLRELTNLSASVDAPFQRPQGQPVGSLSVVPFRELVEKLMSLERVDECFLGIRQVGPTRSLLA